MQTLDKSAIGQKITIYRRSGHDSFIFAVTEVTGVSPRRIETADGRKWLNGRNMTQVDGHLGFELSEYVDGDEQRAERRRRELEAATIFDCGHEWQIRRDLSLLNDEDLVTLAAIGKRLKLAQATRDKENPNASAR